MKFIVQKCEDKSTDWKIISFFADNTNYDDVSVNRVNKKNETFPNFDGIKVGAEIDGNPWKSSTGKYYLFAMPPEGAKPPQRGAGAITKAMERKENGIEKSQDRKEEGIKVSSTMRDAVLIVTKFYPEDSTNEAIKNAIELWRKYLWENWDKEDKDYDPFPSRG